MEYYSVILLDDEELIIQSLRKMISWSDLNCYIRDSANSGEKGKELIDEACPDILIADIKMPGIDGIELIRRLSGEGLKTRFILLSAYGEFEYARQAMKYNVKHYLLKPCNEEQILQAVSEICAELVSANAEDQKQKPKKRYSDITRSVLKIVEESLADPELSLKWIAENRLFMNADYISRKFSQDTGQKFSTYLNAFRMNRARTLLLSQEYHNIYDIADQVGYGNNPRYFSQIFKKVTGVSPTEYIKRETKES